MDRVGRLLLVAALVAAGACSEDAGGETGATVGMLEGRRFDAQPARVVQGTTVRFVNESSEAHTVTAYEDGIPSDAQYFASGDFESEGEARENLADGIIGQEGTYEVTFGVAGTYEFFCIPHEDQGMTGTIVVEAE
jgi:plastocyanin